MWTCPCEPESNRGIFHGAIRKIPLGRPVGTAHGGPRGPHGAPMGRPWAPMGPHGPHGAPWAPWGPSSPVVVRRNFEKFTKIGIWPQVRLLLCGAISKSSQNLAFVHFGGPKWAKKKVEIEGAGPPPSENRTAILRLGAVSRSKMVARRPIWWQKGGNPQGRGKTPQGGNTPREGGN